MRDDIDQARRAGASDAEILTSLVNTRSPMADEIIAAREAGAPDTEILTSITNAQGATARQAIKGQSWGDYGADLMKGAVYGAGQEARAVGTALAKPSDVQGDGSTVNAVGASLQGAGDTVTRMAGGYKPAQFDVMHPIDTASELPKAAAEAAPGILATMGAGAVAGAAGGAVAGPAGALAGGLGGAALYGFLRYWGGNAQARASENGRSAPAQEDFDNTIGESVLQSGVDVATLKAAGILGRTGAGSTGLNRAVMGPEAVKGAGLQGVANGAARAGQNAAIMGAGAGVNSAIGQEAATDSLAGIDPHEVANAAATGVGVGGILSGARLPAQVAGSLKYRTPNEAHTAAVNRLTDHMASDLFPGNPRDASQTKTNVGLIKTITSERVDAISRAADEIGLAPEQRTYLSEYNRLLKAGGTFNEDQVSTLSRVFGDRPEVLDTLMDRSAANWIESTTGSKATRGIGAALRNPMATGGAIGAAFEAAPMLMTGLQAGAVAATGGTALKAALVAKTMSKLSGFSDVYSNPLRSIQDRYATPGSADPAAFLASGEDVVRSLRGQPVQDAPQAPVQAPPAAPVPDAPAPGPMPPTAPPAPVHPPLADMLGPAPTRFAPQPMNPPPAALRGPAPGPAPDAPVPSQMAIPDILTEMRAQAQAENQPLLDVAGLHHRSARSIADNRNLPEPVREAARNEASAIWHQIIAPAEGLSTPEQIKRARSTRDVHTGPAPADFPRDLPTLTPAAPVAKLSDAGRAILQAEGPAFAQAIEAARSPGAVARATEAFVGRFSGADRDIVRAEITKAQETAKASKAKASKTLAKNAKVGAKLKAKTTRTGRPKKPRSR